MIQRVVKTLGWTVLIYVALVGGLYFAQRSMIYMPSYTKPDIKKTGIIGLEEITATTEDGLKLYSWYKPPVDLAKPTLVRFHGNASNVGYSASAVSSFLNAGYGILLVEYRGYSTNPGKPSEDGFYKDGRAFMEWLKAHGTPENSIILYGESIGSGVAVQMATEYPQIHTLILQSPFTNMIAAARVHYPFIPVRWLMKDRFDNLEKIKRIKCPLVLIHGTKDSVVPYYLGEALFKAAPEPKSMITIDGGNHNDLAHFDIGNKVMSVLSE